MAIRDADALAYHSMEPAGKIAVQPTKPCRTQRDLSLAYTPGVAVPCLAIAEDPSKVYQYTSKGNLVAVVSNGTAVLGLGNIGAAAGKPVMEGKGVLFKRFADIDVFDIELNTEDPKEIIRACQLLEPTFGGINLEDIKAPECFEIEEELKRTMKIPVFHDDQHGTAIIAGAAMLNALELSGKQIGDVKAVFNGAGASGISCAKHFIRLGIKRENILFCDTKGVIYKGRTEGMNKYKAEFAVETTARTLAEALRGADIFFGLSTGNCVTPEMVMGMAPHPVIFALANPTPEISFEDARRARPDAIVATGRSDYPNQVNNVLGFPFIFRGALDVRATAITDGMKLAATRALAVLARQDVPDAVCQAYGVDRIEFGPDYIIPKPFDSRVLVWVTTAVAKAAMEDGVAQNPIDLAAYKEQLERRLGKAHELMRIMIQKARRDPQRVAFIEGEHDKVLRAAQILLDEQMAWPVLLGNEAAIRKRIAELKLDLKDVKIIEPSCAPGHCKLGDELYRVRQRKGMTQQEAQRLIHDPSYYGAMMLLKDQCDALIGGIGKHYPETIRPALQVVPLKEGLHRVAGLYIVLTQKGDLYFFGDATVNIEPTAEDLAEIAIMAAGTVREFEIEPRVAMLSFSNFGSTRHKLADKVRRAVEIVRWRRPDIVIDGEMQADTAVVPEILTETYPFSPLKEAGANVLIFPDLEAGNVAYKLLAHLGGATVIGPILMGLGKAVHVLHTHATVDEIVNVAAIAVVDAQKK